MFGLNAVTSDEWRVTSEESDYILYVFVDRPRHV